MKYYTNLLDKEFVEYYLDKSKTLKELKEKIEGLPVLEAPAVYPFKIRDIKDLTKEEQEKYAEDMDNGCMPLCLFDCSLPDNGQKIIIFTDESKVFQTTFYNDEYGCYIDDGFVLRNGMSWMPRPRIMKQYGENS